MTNRLKIQSATHYTFHANWLFKKIHRYHDNARYKEPECRGVFFFLGTISLELYLKTIYFLLILNSGLFLGFASQWLFVPFNHIKSWNVLKILVIPVNTTDPTGLPDFPNPVDLVDFLDFKIHEERSNCSRHWILFDLISKSIKHLKWNPQP